VFKNLSSTDLTKLSEKTMQNNGETTASGVLVFSRDQNLVDELGKKLEGKHAVKSCETLESLFKCLDADPYDAVLVHLGQSTLNGYSAGQFVTGLGEANNAVPLYGLVETNCPPRLRKMADQSIDEFLNLPVDYNRLASLLNDPQDLQKELDTFWIGMPHKELHGKTKSLVTFTPDMFETMEDIKIASKHNVTALLIGETGSGKTFLARLIHEISDRRDERFCTVACGALPPDLLESELFGHVKGSFTGAERDRDGKFAAAGNGTLLLDEIDVLPPEHQAKLLRVIETGEYEQVGSNDTQHSKARLVVASNYNLEDLVNTGSFRTDLFYRLNILSFNLLPLRERPWDIEYLARKFALEHSRTHGIRLRAIENGFLDALRKYQWPGNIREMENVIRRAVLYCQRGVLQLGDLPSSIRSAANGIPTYPSTGSNTRSSQGIRPGGPVLAPNVQYLAHGPRHQMENAMPVGGPNHMQSGPANYAQSSGQMAPHADEIAYEDGKPKSLETRVEQLEQRIIEESLQRNNHRRKETAAELGISRVTLYNKMKKFGLL
jgi:DNA-binding NtrC family response regulator